MMLSYVAAMSTFEVNRGTQVLLSLVVGSGSSCDSSSNSKVKSVVQVHNYVKGKWKQARLGGSIKRGNEYASPRLLLCSAASQISMQR